MQTVEARARAQTSKSEPSIARLSRGRRRKALVEAIATAVSPRPCGRRLTRDGRNTGGSNSVLLGVKLGVERLTVSFPGLLGTPLFQVTAHSMKPYTFEHSSLSFPVVLIIKSGFAFASLLVTSFLT